MLDVRENQPYVGKNAFCVFRRKSQKYGGRVWNTKRFKIRNLWAGGVKVFWAQKGAISGHKRNAISGRKRNAISGRKRCPFLGARKAISGAWLHTNSAIPLLLLLLAQAITRQHRRNRR